MPSILQLPSWRTPKPKNINMKWIFTESAFFMLHLSLLATGMYTRSVQTHTVDKQDNVHQGNSILP